MYDPQDEEFVQEYLYVELESPDFQECEEKEEDSDRGVMVIDLFGD